MDMQKPQKPRKFSALKLSWYTVIIVQILNIYNYVVIRMYVSLLKTFV